MRTFLQTVLVISAILLGIASITHAQRVVASDSIPLFYSTADEMGNSSVAPVLKTKGRVTQLALTPEGTITISAFRQHVGFFDASPTKGLPVGANSLPGLVQYRYDPATGLQPISTGIFNLNGGLRQPIPYKFFDLISNRGTINKDKPLATSESGLDYLATLSSQPKALAYEGERKTVRRIFLNGGALRYQTIRYYYAPYAAMYLVAGTNERELAAIRPKNAYVVDNDRVQVLVRDGNGVRMIDSTGKSQAIDLPIDKDMSIRAENSYFASSGSGFFDIAKTNTELGLDLVFGPALMAKNQDSSFVFVRLDKQGKVVCHYRFKIPIEAGYTGAPLNGSWMAGNEKESLLHIEFSKGLFKTMAFNVKINTATGVVYVKEESKDDQRKVKMPAAGIAKQFYHLVSLPNGDNLAVSVNSTSTAGDDHYSTVHLSADGVLKNYYAHNRLAFRSQLFVNRVPVCIALKDGRILLLTDEPWGSSVPYQPYGNIDLELASGFAAQIQSLAEVDKPNLLFNATTLQQRWSQANNSTGNRLLGALDRLSGSDPRATGKEYTEKRQLQMESQEYITYPVMYLIDPQKGTSETVKGPYGFVIPQQTYAFYDYPKNELHFLLRSTPGNRLQPYKGTPMTGVFLKLFKLDLTK
ncbi:hypothetical protein [Runella limosa]|uniref:hypothetical protein n=1 Tax=Runella limosa TaxID=370978 RepID=UPI0003FB079E|nr:hypothetical protein [Runella limosa]